MLNSFKNKIRQNLKNIPGKSVSERIVVIESDDWGSIRMPNLATYEKLKNKGVDLDGESERYNRNDTLANKEDMEELFNVLTKFSGSDGLSPVFTAVSLVANPDFVKIKDSGFNQYFYKTIQQTFEEKNERQVLGLWKKGIENRLFVPEFHGREHLNVTSWLRALKNGDDLALLCFEHGIWGYNNRNKYNLFYQSSFDLEFFEDLDFQKEIIADGLRLFEKLHGYKARFFVPPNGPFNNTLEETAALNGIEFMSVSKVQNEALGEGKTRKVYHTLGERNKHGQIYITRNAFFEPSDSSKNWVEACLNDIHYAFKWKKPAVISSHRVNYIGALNPKNREKGLNQLDELLRKIKVKWPDVRFMTSSELGDLLKKSNN